MRISVYITSYNQRDYLQQAFESVLAQTRRPDEIVIVDDASQDGSQELITAYGQEWPELVVPVLRTRNGGVVAARNHALKHITGDLMSFVDGDDYWREDKLEHEVEALTQNRNVRWAYSIPVVVDSRGRCVRPMALNYDGVNGDILFEVLVHEVSLRDWTAETELVREVGRFDPQLEIFEDWDFKIRMSKRAEIAWVPKATVFYRCHNSGLSSAPPWTYLSNLQRVYRKHQAAIEALPAAERGEVLSSKRHMYFLQTKRALSMGKTRGIRVLKSLVLSAR
jgi:glycosyltransferase involved in cell wall biosynthesis